MTVKKNGALLRIEIILIRRDQCLWIIKIKLVRGDVISWVTGLRHYNASQLITSLNVRGEVNSWVKDEPPTKNTDSTEDGGGGEGTEMKNPKKFKKGVFF